MKRRTSELIFRSCRLAEHGVGRILVRLRCRCGVLGSHDGACESDLIGANLVISWSRYEVSREVRPPHVRYGLELGSDGNG